MFGTKTNRFDELGYKVFESDFNASAEKVYTSKEEKVFFGKLKTLLSYLYDEVFKLKKQRELNGLIATAGAVLMSYLLTKF